MHSLFSLLFMTVKIESLYDIESTKTSRRYGQAKIDNYLTLIPQHFDLTLFISS